MYLPCKSLSQSRTMLLVSALAVSLVAGCPEPDGTLPEPQPDAVEPDVVVPDPVEETVTGESGGTVTIGEGELEIPADAVEGDVEITVTATPPDEAEDLPEEGVVEGLVYDFGPDGLAFEEPADLALPIPDDIEIDDTVAIAFLDEESGEWIGVPTIVSEGSVTAKIHHFTKYAVVKELETSCNISTCGQLSELDGYWRLDDRNVDEQCTFARKPPAACVTNFVSTGGVTDARLLFGDNELNGTIELKDVTSFFVPVGCEDEVFLGESAGASCAPRDGVDGGAFDAGQLSDGGIAPDAPLPLGCERVEGGGCRCVIEAEETPVYLGGSIEATEEGRIAMAFADDDVGFSSNDEMYFCRDGDFMKMYGDAQGSTMALSFVLVGSDSDPDPIPLDAPNPRAQVFVVPDFSLSPNISNIVYATNSTNTSTTIEATYKPISGAEVDLGVLRTEIAANKVTKITRDVHDALAAQGVSGTTRGVLTLTTRSDIQFYVARNVGSDRVGSFGFEERDVVESVQHFPYVLCGPGAVARLGVYNASDTPVSFNVSAREADTDTLLDTDNVQWTGLDSQLRIPPHSSVSATGFCVIAVGGNSRHAVTISASGPIRAWGANRVRGSSSFLVGVAAGHESIHHPVVSASDYTSVGAAIQNVSAEDADVTVEVVNPTGTSTSTYEISIPAGMTRRLPIELIRNLPRGRSNLFIKQDTTAAKLVSYVTAISSSGRAEVLPYAPETQVSAWTIPYMPYGPTSSQVVYATSEEPAVLRYRAFDDDGVAYAGDNLASLAGNWATIRLDRLLRTSLEEQGFDNRKVAFTIESVGGEPILLSSQYYSGWHRSLVVPRLPAQPCNAQTSEDSDGDGTLDCLEACPNDPDKLLPGLCGCGVEDLDPCPAPPDAGFDAGVVIDGGDFDGGDFDGGDFDGGNFDGGDFDGGFTPMDGGDDSDGGDDLDGGFTPMDAGPPDAGPIDAGAPDAGPVDAGPIDAGAPDAGPVDAGAPDAGPVDAGAPDAGPVDAGAPDAGPIDAGPPPPPGECGDELNEVDCTAEDHCFWNNNACGDNPDADCTDFDESTACDEHNFCFWNGQECAAGGAACDFYPTQVSCEAQGSLCEWDGAECRDPTSSCDGLPDEPSCEANTACDWDGFGGGFCGEDPFGPDDCGGFDGDQFGCESSTGCLFHQGLNTCHDSCYQFTTSTSCDASGGSCEWDFGGDVCNATGGSGDCSMYFDEFACDADPGCSYDFLFMECVPN